MYCLIRYPESFSAHQDYVALTVYIHTIDGHEAFNTTSFLRSSDRVSARPSEKAEDEAGNRR